MRQIWAISKLAVLENLRKQILQVVVILTVATIGAASALSLYDTGVQIKIMKDLSLAAVLLAGGMLAIVTSAGGVSTDLAQRTAYPILARPLPRSVYITARYLGSVLTCLICMAAIGSVFLLILGFLEQRFDWQVAVGMGFVMLQVCVIASVGTLFGMLVSPMVAATLCLFVFALGQVKVGYLHQLIERMDEPVGRWLVSALYYLLPNLDSFSLKDALVHNLSVPLEYLWLVAAYGVLYSCVMVWLSGLVLSWKRL